MLCFVFFTIISNLLSSEDPSITLFHKYIELNRSEIIEHVEHYVEKQSWIELPLMDFIAESNDFYRTKDGVYYLEWFYAIENMKPLEKITEDFYVYNHNRVFYDSGFGKTSTTVYFQDKVIQDADPKTFQPIDGYFSRDHQYVFCGSEIIVGADPETFSPFEIYESSRGFNYDKNHVYYMTEIVENADPETFVTWEDSGYGKDKNHVFFEKHLLTEANPETFEPINTTTDYGTDGEHVYFENILISQADPETFEPQESTPCSDYCDYIYAKDKNNIYYRGIVVKGGDPNTFTRHAQFHREKDQYGYIVEGERASQAYEEGIAKQIADSKLPPVTKLGSNYTVMNKSIYYNEDYRSPYSEPIKGADVSTFEVINTPGYQGYAKDKNHAYYGGCPIHESDPQTFEHIDDYYSKDENSIFYKCTKLEGINPNNFEIVNNMIIKDENTVFFGDKRLDADAVTFTGVKQGYETEYFIDKEHIYLIYDEEFGYEFKTPKVFTIQVNDPSSYTRHGNYLTNGQYIFELDMPRTDIDAKTVYFINSRIFLDKNYIYLYGKPIFTTREILTSIS